MTLVFPKEFTLEEMTISQAAARYGINNMPKGSTLDNLWVTANKMKLVRDLLGSKPIIVSSGYRSPAVNKKVGGSDNSAHTKGWAVDFTCPGFGTPLEICEVISSSKIMDDVDQLIHEYNSWVHISWDPRNRKQVLTIDRKGTRQGL